MNRIGLTLAIALVLPIASLSRAAISAEATTTQGLAQSSAVRPTPYLKAPPL